MSKSKPGVVARIWRSYRAHVIPSGAPPVQIQECRRAFYAGFGMALVWAREEASVPEDEATCVAMMEAALEEARCPP